MQEEPLKKGPLEGILVLDFSRVLAGPYCSMILADMGARVIKIEKFGTGDDTRAFGPFVDGASAYFMCFNRGKESIVLDIKSPRDRARWRGRIIAMAPQRMQSPPRLRAVRPKLYHACARSIAQTGRSRG